MSVGAPGIRFGRGLVAHDSECLGEAIERFTMIGFGGIRQPKAAHRLGTVVTVQGQVASKTRELGVIRRPVGEKLFDRIHIAAIELDLGAAGSRISVGFGQTREAILSAVKQPELPINTRQPEPR